MYVEGRRRTQLRHLGRQLLGLTWKQKLQNVLLEKYHYTEWWGRWEEPLQSSRKCLCTKGKWETGNTFFIKNTKNFKLFLWGWRLDGVSGPCHLCGPTFSKLLKEGRSFEKITILLWVNLSTFHVTLRKSWLLFLWWYQLLKDKGHALINIISSCGHTIKESNEEWKNI